MTTAAVFESVAVPMAELDIVATLDEYQAHAFVIGRDGSVSALSAYGQTPLDGIGVKFFPIVKPAIEGVA